MSIGLGAAGLASGLAAWLVGIGLPLLAAAVWGVFNVPGDRSRSGEAPVAIAGPVRLVLEAGILAAVIVLLAPVSVAGAVALAAAVTVHYLLSANRIRWLLAH